MKNTFRIAYFLKEVLRTISLQILFLRNWIASQKFNCRYNGQIIILFWCLALEVTILDLYENVLVIILNWQMMWTWKWSNQWPIDIVLIFLCKWSTCNWMYDPKMFVKNLFSMSCNKFGFRNYWLRMHKLIGTFKICISVFNIFLDDLTF